MDVMRSRTNFGSNRLFTGLLAIIVALIPLIDARAQDPTRFEGDIKAFENADLANRPPSDPVLFVGSSSVRMWTDLAAAFPDYPVMNRGFGGSHMSDLLYYFDRVVAVYDPVLIVVYEGDNDLAGGKSVDQVYTDYVAFLAMVDEELPGARVAFLAVKPSPSRAQYLEPMRQLNDRLEALAATDPDVWYIDVFTPMLNAAGQPRPELFGSDMLHMNAAGYALWKSIVEPVLNVAATPRMQSFLFDFGPADAVTKNGPAPDDPVSSWNNVTETVGASATGHLRGLVNTENEPTGMVLRMISPFNAGGPNRSGTLESTVFPANATRDSLYGNTETWSGFSDVAPSFKLIGLNRERVYDFTFYGSRLGVGDIREADYTVTGEDSATVAYDPANNIDGTAVVAGIVPDALGEITISLAPTARNNNSYHFIYLGAMRVDERPPQQPVVFTAEPADQTVLEFRLVTFEAAVEGTPPYVVQWFRDGLPIADADELTYTIEQATLDFDGALFSVSVSNAIGSVDSRDAALHVVADVNAPLLLSAESANGLTVSLLFDESLDGAAATAIENYRVNDGTVGVFAAELDADGRTVTLALATPLTGVFTVTVAGVRDLAGNEIAPGTTATGEIVPQVLLFDFGSSGTPTGNGPAPDDPAGFWNNVTDGIGATVGARLDNLVTDRNVPTAVGLVILSRFNGANTNGTLASTQFPPNATRDSLFGNTESFSGLANVFPSFKLTGLDPVLTYQLTFYASRMGVGDNRETLYTVTGASSGLATLNPARNVDESVALSAIAPTADGEITISLSPTANNNNGNHFTYLGAMRVEPTLPAESR